MTLTSPRILSVQVGAVRTHGTLGADDPLERPWTTAFFKEPVDGPRRLSRVGVEGDEQYETRVHGGPEMAALAYAADHYPLWRSELGLREMGPGGFGENLTVFGLDEGRVRIGDVYEIGQARVQVSSPRGPCANISRRWKTPTLMKRVTATGRTGWYLRVLEEGNVEAGDRIRLIERPCPEWTVAWAFRLRIQPDLHLDDVARLAECALLAPPWRAKFAKSFAQHAGGRGPRDEVDSRPAAVPASGPGQ